MEEVSSAYRHSYCWNGRQADEVTKRSRVSNSKDGDRKTEDFKSAT